MIIGGIHYVGDFAVLARATGRSDCWQDVFRKSRAEGMLADGVGVSDWRWITVRNRFGKRKSCRLIFPVSLQHFKCWNHKRKAFVNYINCLFLI